MPRGDPDRVDTGVDKNGRRRELQCPECDLFFRRREHLSRHLDVHRGIRAFACARCNKSFSRQDTLRRHVRTHGPAALAELRLERQSTTQPPACQACAKSKQRCEGRGTENQPCDTCRKKGRECVFYRPSSNGHSSWGNSLSLVEGDLAVGSSESHESGIGSSEGQISDQTACHDASAAGMEPNNMEFTGMHVAQQWFDLPLWADFIGDPCNLTFSAIPSPSNDWVSPEVQVAEDTIDGETNPSQQPYSLREEEEEEAEEEEDALISDLFDHVSAVPDETYARIVKFAEVHLVNRTHQIPSLAHLNAYVQLYFEHFHPRMPFLHMPTFTTRAEAWNLVLAAAATGCQYSTAAQSPTHLMVFGDLARLMVQRDADDNTSEDPLFSAQALLLMYHLLAFGGTRRELLHLQLHRNTLITYCRRLLAPHGSILRNSPSFETLPDDPWATWVKSEAVSRLLYFTWILECLHEVLFTLPPLLVLHEMQMPLPCSEQLWAANSEEWQKLHAVNNLQSVCSTLAVIPSDPGVLRNISGPARLVVLLAAFSQWTSARSLCHAVQYQQQSSPYSVLTKSMEQCVQATIKTTLEFSQDEIPGKNSTIGTCAILARLIAILSLTPLQLLYPFSSWQTTVAGSQKARRELQIIFKDQPEQARMCAYHAGQLLALFRQQSAMIHLDPFVLLIATIYLWAFTELALAPLSSASGAGTFRSAVIRIDQPLQNEKLSAWVEDGTRFRPHVTQVGALDTSRSTARLLKEAAGILAMKGSNKSNLAKTLSKLLLSQARGKIPTIGRNE